jgi:hypothetical protein
MQQREISFQVIAVFAGCDLIDSHCAIAAHAPVGLTQVLDGQQVREIRESKCPVSPSHFCDPLKFRRREIRIRRSGHVSLQRRPIQLAPSLRRVPRVRFPDIPGSMGESDSLSLFPTNSGFPRPPVPEWVAVSWRQLERNPYPNHPGLC